jgi:aryl-alcohol dehydrogenase-like predicted oxidoreductase
VRERYAKSVLALAVRWALDAPGVSVASWGGRSPEQLEPLDEVVGWSLDGETKRTIDEILRKVVTDRSAPNSWLLRPARHYAR